MATTKRSEQTQDDRTEMQPQPGDPQPSQGTENAPEADDAYFSTETSAKQPDSLQAETKGETGQALQDNDQTTTTQK